MEVILEGSKNVNKPWIGKVVECFNCKARLKLEEADPVRSVREISPIDDGELIVKCSCGFTITFRA